MEWVWSTGNDDSYNSNHDFVISKSHLHQTSYDLKSVNETILGYIVKFSGYFHDLGKINRFFQEKITNKKRQSDPYRHEVVSALMLYNIYSTFGCKTDNDFFSLFKSEDDIEKTFSIFDNGVLFDKRKHERYINIKVKRGLYENQTPMLSAILHLVLTHHKGLPGNIDGINNNISVSYRVDPFVHCAVPDHDYSDEDIDNCMHYEVSDRYEPPWKNSAWKTNVSALAQQVLGCEESFNLKEYYPFLEYYGKYNLIFGDYIISSDISKHSKVPGYYAKTSEEPGKFGQHIAEHTIEVGKMAHHIFRKNCNHTYKGITKNEIPNIIKYASANDKYIWQDTACYNINNIPDIKDNGMFGLLMADTGAGKTIAIPKIMNSLSDELRYTLLMGLKTLTLQSGNVYKNVIKFNEKQFSTIIGSDISKKLFAIDNGSEADDLFSFDLPICKYNNKYVKEFDFDAISVLKYKHKQFMASPIILATIDYFIHSVDVSRNSNTLLRMRVHTSDLVIDEVDALEYRDMLSVAKLAFITGLYGRKLLLSSATISPVIAKTFYQLYQAGYSLYCSFYNIPKKIYCGWFGNNSPHKVIECDSNETFSSTHEIYTSDFIDSGITKSSKRKGDILKIDNLTDSDDVYNAVVNQSYDLHNTFNTKIHGKELSIGLVRWNRIKNARDFAMYLANNVLDENYDVKVICYHSNMELLIRDYYEKNMDVILNRKNDDFYKQPELMEWIKNSSSKKLILIISSTSVEEVGKDHDYDWGIFDPISTRSAKQASGRINRHREYDISKPNVFFLNVPMRYISERSVDKHYPYSNPGIQSSTVTSPQLKLSTPYFDELMDFESMRDIIDSKWILKIPDCDVAELTHKEHLVLDDILNNGVLSVNNWYKDPYGILSTKHFKDDNRFRKPVRGTRKITLINIDGEDLWTMLSGKDDNVNKTLSSCNIVYKNRFLFNIDFDKQLEIYMKKLKVKDKKDAIYKFRRLEMMVYDINADIEYDFLLGGYMK